MTDRRVTQATIGHDSALDFVGSSPTPGDRTALGLVLPPDPTPNQFRRYLCLLASVQVPTRTRGYVRGIRQLLTVGWDQQAGGDLPVTIPHEVSAELLSPVFRFLDGNVSWHLTFRAAPYRFGLRPSQGQPRSFSRSFDVTSPAILYDTLPVSLGGPGYAPPNGGHPIGDAVGFLGQWYDLRYPWRSVAGPYPGLDFYVEGPGTLMLWASVYQTDPSSRPQPPSPPEPLTFPWTMLWSAIQAARFKRIAAELSVDLVKIGAEHGASSDTDVLEHACVATTGGTSHGS